MKPGAICGTASSISCGTLLDGRYLLSSWPRSSETPKYAWTRQISMKITESVRQTNMSYKRCLTGPCERLKAETGKRGSDRHDRPNPLQDILVIVENIRGNILSISFLIPWDSCPRNQQRGISDSQGNTKFPLVSAMRRGYAIFKGDRLVT